MKARASLFVLVLSFLASLANGQRAPQVQPNQLVPSPGPAVRAKSAQAATATPRAVRSRPDASGPATELVVNVMPGFPNPPRVLPEQRRPVRPGLSTIIWGNVNDGDGTASGATYTWTFSPNADVSVTDDGDLTGTVTDTAFVHEVVTFELLNGSTREVLSATLTVELDGMVDARFVELEVIALDDPISDAPLEKLRIDVDIAAEEALRYLYLHQNANGSWTGRDTLATTGFTTWAFENLGHLPTLPSETSIYAKTVQRGLDYIFANAVTVGSLAQPAATEEGGATVPGESDLNDNDRAVRLGSAGTSGYHCPIMCSAIVASAAPDRLVGTGPLFGATYREVVEDVVDWLGVTISRGSGAWGGRGGWTYNPSQNGNRSDMSINSWAYVAMEGALMGFEIDVPEWLKAECEVALYYHQSNVAGPVLFGYSGTSPAFTGGMATTGGGISGLALIETMENPGEFLATFPEPLNTIAAKRAAALGHAGQTWGLDAPSNSTHGDRHRGNPYSMWTMARALRLTASALDLPAEERVLLENGGVMFDWETGEEDGSGQIAAPGTAREGYFPWLVRNQRFTGSPDTHGRWDQGWYGSVMATSMYTLILSPRVFFESSCDVPIPDPIDVFPAHQSAYRAGTELVFTGRAVSATPARPILDVRIDGTSAAVLDPLGRFFEPITLAEGENTWIVTVVDDCGEQDFTYTIFGAAPDEVIFDDLSEVTVEMEPTYTDTTWNHETQTLWFDLEACNRGETDVAAPLVAVITNLTPEEAEVVAPDGTTGDGRPFIEVAFANGDDLLSPDECTTERLIGIHNPLGQNIQFDLEWYSQGNLPPTFVSIPPTTVETNGTYVYAAMAVDPDGDELAYSVVQGPPGFVIDAESGQVLWPDVPPFEITYTATIRAEDGKGGAAEQSYGISVVTSTNEPPIITSTPIVEGMEGVLYTYDVEADDPEGLELFYALVVAPDGMTIDPATGLIEWTPGPMQAGLNDVEVSVSDPPGASATQVFTIDVAEGLNAPPMITSEPVTEGEEGELYTYDVEAEDPDGDTLVFSLLESPPGMTIDAASGLIQWAPGATAAGPNPVRVLADDQRGGTAEQAYVIDVNEGLNAPPVITSAPPLEGGEGQLYTYDVEADDPDGDALLHSLVTGPAGMQIDPATGLVQWTPGATDAGPHPVEVEVDDQRGGTDRQDWVIVVAELINNPPMITSTPTTIAMTGVLYEYTLTASDPDGDTVIFQLFEGPDGMALMGSTLQWTPQASQQGSFMVRVLADDQRGGMDEQEYSISVAVDNEPPSVSVSATPPIVDLGSTTLISVEADDDSGSVEVLLTIEGVEFVLDEAGTVTFEPTESGSYLVLAVASDPAGNMSMASTTVLAQEPSDAENLPPVITSMPPTMAEEGARYVYPILAEDPEGDALTFLLDQSPPGATLDPSTGLLLWDVPADSSGIYEVLIRVEDAPGDSASQPYTLTVVEGAQAPSITSTPVLVANPGELYSYQATAEDPDDTTLQWSVAGPEGMTVSSSGLVSWMAPADPAPLNPVTLTVADPSGLEDEQPFTIAVADPTSGPPIVEITSPTGNARITDRVPIIGTVLDEDLAGYRVELTPTWRTEPPQVIAEGLNPVTADVLATFDPRCLCNGTWLIRIVAVDAMDQESSDSVELSVQGANKPGALRIQFNEFRIRTSQSNIDVLRVYDALDRSDGELGRGWRYDWSLGHVEQPERTFQGWNLVQINFIDFEVFQQYPHPIRFHLDNNDFYDFELQFDHIDQFSSINEVVPRFDDVLGNGGTLIPLDENFNPTVSNLQILGNEILGLFNFEPWEPRYYRLITPFGEEFVFDTQTGESVIEIGTDGKQLVRTSEGIFYDSEQILSFERDAQGRVMLARNLRDGTSATYEYESNGTLVHAVTAADDDQIFIYDEDAYLTSYRIAGQQPHVYEYDDMGRVIRQTTPEGTFTETTFDDDARRVITTDAAGNSIIADYDTEGRVTRTEDPLGRVTTFTYVPDTTLEASRTNDMGETWEYGYDSRRQRNLIRDPLGNEIRFDYDATGSRIVMATDGEGRAFEEVMDPDGQIVAWKWPDQRVVQSFSYPDEDTVVTTDGLGFDRAVTYDDRGRVVLVTDDSGRTRMSQFDDDTRTATFVDFDGNTQTLEYDGIGRFKSLQSDRGMLNYDWGVSRTIPESVSAGETDYNIHCYSDGGIRQIQVDGRAVGNYQRDALGRLASVNAEGRVEQYKYDAAGQVTELTTDEGTSMFEYDGAGRVTRVQLEHGPTRVLDYDDAGRLTRIDDGTRGSVQLDYDASNKITSIMLGDSRSVGLTYDSNGFEQRLDYPGGLTIERTYYAALQDDGTPYVATEKSIDGTYFEYEYNAFGDISKVVDTDGLETTFEYGEDQSLSEITDRMGRVTRFEYESQRLSRIESPEGRVRRWDLGGNGEVQWTREDGSVVSTLVQNGQRTVTLPDGQIEQTIEEGSRTTELGGSGGTVIYDRDLDENIVSYSTVDGARIEATYSSSNELLAVSAMTPGGALFQSAYAYDANGDLTSLVGPGGTSSFEYDDQHRLTRITRPGGGTSEYTYTPFDRPSSILHKAPDGSVLESVLLNHDSSGRVVSQSTLTTSNEFEYDLVGRLRLVRDLMDGSETIYGYDAVGNRTTIQDSSGTQTFFYDNDDRLVSSMGPKGDFLFSYTDRGALSSIQSPEGLTTFEYDELDRLTRLIQTSGEAVDYAYDVSGRLLSRTDDEGQRRYLPMPSNLFGFVDTALTYSPGANEDPEHYALGPMGIHGIHRNGTSRFALLGSQQSVLGTVTAEGAVMARFQYDPWGNRNVLAGQAELHGAFGERQDSSSGHIFLRARHYSPSLGVFLTPDRYEARTSDPRTLHRYLYSFADPLNRVDRSGLFSLGEINVSVTINGILSTISSAISFCIKDKVRRSIFKGLANWALKNIGREVAEGLKSSLTKLLGGNDLTGAAVAGLSESSLHLQLAKWMCGGGPMLTSGSWLFQLKVSRCGDFRRSRRTGNFYRFYSCFRNPGRAAKGYGIDIVYRGARLIPFELKVTKSTAKVDQVYAYCRFASKHGINLVFWVFARFPCDAALHSEFATACAFPFMDSQSCSGDLIGSLYIAMGLNLDKCAGEKGLFASYLPDVSICGKL